MVKPPFGRMPILVDVGPYFVRWKSARWSCFVRIDGLFSVFFHNHRPVRDNFPERPYVRLIADDVDRKTRRGDDG